jgi:ABC-type polysaccharide/polyol phosphate transport system ATPase subunit
MSEAPRAVFLDHVSKRYTLGGAGYGSLREEVGEFWRGLRRGGKGGRQRELWALRDVSLETYPGQAVGVLGPNGAGKSTILKLIAGIAHPTAGKLQVRGRLGALIEVGAGIHPELTGRENVYLYGSIIGLTKREIAQKFDRIVAFAELEQFLDTPVKKYSSGMQMRLAFAVAAHVEPDVLLVDEVLAVGDMRFQLRCLERIRQMRSEGTCILLVSHNLHAVCGLCDTAVCLAGGRLQDVGDPRQVQETYKRLALAADGGRDGAAATVLDDRPVRILDARILDGRGRACETFRTGESLVVHIDFEARQRVQRPVFGVAIYGEDGTYVYGPNTRFDDWSVPCIEGRGTVEYRIDTLNLLAGGYRLTIGILEESAVTFYDVHDRRYRFDVVSDLLDHGLVFLPHRWRLLDPLE